MYQITSRFIYHGPSLFLTNISPQPYFFYIGRYELLLYNSWSTYDQNSAALSVILLFLFMTLVKRRCSRMDLMTLSLLFTFSILERHEWWLPSQVHLLQGLVRLGDLLDTGLVTGSGKCSVTGVGRVDRLSQSQIESWSRGNPSNPPPNWRLLTLVTLLYSSILSSVFMRSRPQIPLLTSQILWDPIVRRTSNIQRGTNISLSRSLRPFTKELDSEKRCLTVPVLAARELLLNGIQLVVL